jgi:tetratricopeptide (TPR) repeat protein
MQDEIVARLASALNAQLVTAEARRAEKAPNPDSTDLYFQGMAWFYKGLTPRYMAQSRSYFDRALVADPNNVDAVIGLAGIEAIEGVNSFAADPVASFAAAEAKLIEALSSVPDHVVGHMWLGLVLIWTKRAAEGIAKCEHALALDRNVARAEGAIGFGKILIGRAEEAEAHVAEALRRSPRDTVAFVWMTHVGLAKNLLGSWEQAVAWCRRAIEANRNYPRAYFQLAVALAQLGRLDEAHSSVTAGIAIHPTFSLSRAHADWTALSDDPTYLGQLGPVLEGLRMAGIPEQ